MTSAQNENNQDIYNNLVDMHEKTLKNIRELQDVETEIFNNINEINSSGGENTQKIRQRINKVREVRVDLYNRLTNIYQNTIDNTSFAKDSLINNNAMYQVVNDQLINVEDELKKIKQEMQNKKRMVMIGQYEYSKYREYKNILKLLVYCMIVIAITTVLMGFPFFPNVIGYIVIVITIAILICNLVVRLYFNVRRNNIEYHKFNNDSVKGTDSGGTVRKSLSDLFGKKDCISPQSLEETYKSVASSGQSSEESTEGFTLFENFKEGNTDTKTQPPDTMNDAVQVIAEQATAEANARHIGTLKGTKAAAEDAAEEAEDAAEDAKDAAKSAKSSEISAKNANSRSYWANKNANTAKGTANSAKSTANKANSRSYWANRKANSANSTSYWANRNVKKVNSRLDMLEKDVKALKNKSPFTLLKNIFQTKKQEEDKIMETQKTLQRKEKRENLYKKKLIMLDSYNYDDKDRYFHI